MYLPNSHIGPWAKELVDACYVTRQDRIERGVHYRNMYLTGSFKGEREVYNLTYKHIDKLSSWLFSPTELRFAIEPEAQPSPDDLAMARRASIVLNTRMRRGKCATAAAQANTWALVKGIAFVKLLWDNDNKQFMPRVVQPEMMGVLREDVGELDRQEAFVHSTYWTPDAFRKKIERYPNATELMRKVGKSLMPTPAGEQNPDVGGAMREIVLPGLYPYQSQGTGNTQRGIVQWLGGPRPTLDPRVQAQLIREDELWIKDDQRDDYTTISMVDDVVVDGDLRHRNLFADPFHQKSSRKIDPTDEDNPLTGHHPFVPFCPNRLEGYFWGMSEVELLSLLQMSLNDRVNGINRLLRLQEDPPRKFTGSTVTPKAYNIARKPGGMLSDPNPNARMESLAPEIPAGLWESMHEIVDMFRAMGGFTPSMSGLGDQGVRSNSQVESLIAVGSPEIKDRALLVEESVEEMGGLGLDILKAKDPTEYHAFLMPGDQSLLADIAAHDENIIEAPAKGMRLIPFLLKRIPDDMTVRVDSHSSSPAFAAETQRLMFALAKIGAATPEEVVSRVHPPNEEGMIASLERRSIQQAELVAQHPELAFKAGKRK